MVNSPAGTKRIDTPLGSVKSTGEGCASVATGASVHIGACVGDDAVGYSVSYNKFQDGSFYLWIAGVMPKYRKRGVFSLLTKHTESWAAHSGYSSIVVRTWNKRVGMRIALAKLGYDIVGFEEKQNVGENRLIYKKPI